MKIMTIFFVIIFLTMNAQAQTSSPLQPSVKNVMCGDSATVKNFLKSYGEDDFELIGIQAVNDNFHIALGIARNHKTGTFSIIETTTTNKTCIVGVGKFEKYKKQEGGL